MSDLVGLSRHQGKADVAARNRKEGLAAAAAWPRAWLQRPAGQPRTQPAEQPARPASTACCLLEP